MRALTAETMARQARRTSDRTRVHELDQAIRTAADWIVAVAMRLNLTSASLALETLKSTLQALRRQLEPDLAAEFGQHLPLYIKALYYDGWTAARDTPAATKRAFLARLGGSGTRQRGIKRERAAKAALEVICGGVPAAALVEVAAALPPDLRELWPDEPAPYFDLRASAPLSADGAMRGSRTSPSTLRRATRRAPGETLTNALPERRGPSRRTH